MGGAKVLGYWFQKFTDHWPGTRGAQMGGCQNYGPFLGPYYNTASNMQGTQKGTMFLTTTQMGLGLMVLERGIWRRVDLRLMDLGIGAYRNMVRDLVQPLFCRVAGVSCGCCFCLQPSTRPMVVICCCQNVL